MLSKLWKSGAVALVLALTFSACAVNDNGDNGDGNGNDLGTRGTDGQNGRRVGINNRDWDNGRNNNFTSAHNNTRMQMDDRIADAVADMPDVDSASVLLTERNAYVAVKLDNGTGYTGGRAGTLNNGNRARGNGTTDFMGRRGPAAGAAGDDGVTDAVKSRIASKVKQMAPQVRNVYVSANPDFVNRMRGYGDRFRGGQPIRGMIIEFNRMVERVFPNNVTR